MPGTFSPNGFDEDHKQRAAQCEVQWDAATAAMALIGVAATTAAVAAAAPFFLLAALGPVMRYPFTRAKLDPPRLDFYEPAHVRPPLADPAMLGPAHGFVDFGPLLAAFSADRAAAHLDAMVTSAERALGAYRNHSHAGMEARLIETREHAQHARSALHVAGYAARIQGVRNAELQPEKLSNLSARALSGGSRQRSVHEFILDARVSDDLTLAEQLAACGELGTQALTLRPFTVRGEPTLDFAELTEALFLSRDWVASLLNGFPETVDEFIGWGTRARLAFPPRREAPATFTAQAVAATAAPWALRPSS